MSVSDAPTFGVATSPALSDPQGNGAPSPRFFEYESEDFDAGIFDSDALRSSALGSLKAPLFADASFTANGGTQYDSHVTPIHLGFQFFLYGPDLGRGSISRSVGSLNLLNGIIGVGILALVDFFVVAGIPFGILTYVVVVFASKYSYFLLHELSTRTQQLSYGQIALKISGPYMYFLVDALLLSNVFMEVSTLVIGIRDMIDLTLHQVNKWMQEDLNIPKRLNIIVLMATTFVWVLCNKLSGSAPNRGAYVILVYLVVICVVMISFAVVGYSNNITEFLQCVPSTRTIEYIPIVLFAFDCSGKFMTIYGDLPQPVPDNDAKKFIDYPLFMTLGLYTLSSVLSTLTVGNNPDDFVHRLDESNNEYLEIILAIWALPFILLFALKSALWFRSITKSLTFLIRVISQPEPMSYLKELSGKSNLILNTMNPPRRLVIFSSTCIISISIVLALVSTRLTTVVTFIGTFASTPLTFIIPPTLYLVKMKHKPTKDLIGPILLIIFGVIVLGSCFVGTALRFVNDSDLEKCTQIN